MERRALHLSFGLWPKRPRLQALGSSLAPRPVRVSCGAAHPEFRPPAETPRLTAPIPASAAGGEDLGPVPARHPARGGALGVADTQLVERAVEDVLAVTGAVHPGRHHLGGRVLTGGDVLAPAPVRIARGVDPGPGTPTLGILVGEVAAGGHVLTVAVGHPVQRRVQTERRAAGVGPGPRWWRRARPVGRRRRRPTGREGVGAPVVEDAGTDEVVEGAVVAVDAVVDAVVATVLAAVDVVVDSVGAGVAAVDAVVTTVVDVVAVVVEDDDEVDDDVEGIAAVAGVSGVLAPGMVSAARPGEAGSVSLATEVSPATPFEATEAVSPPDRTRANRATSTRAVAANPAPIRPRDRPSRSSKRSSNGARQISGSGSGRGGRRWTGGWASSSRRREGAS